MKKKAVCLCSLLLALTLLLISCGGLKDTASCGIK